MRKAFKHPALPDVFRRGFPLKPSASTSNRDTHGRCAGQPQWSAATRELEFRILQPVCAGWGVAVDLGRREAPAQTAFSYNYCTVRVRFVVCVSEPAVAVTEVVAVVRTVFVFSLSGSSCFCF